MTLASCAESNRGSASMQTTPKLLLHKPDRYCKPGSVRNMALGLVRSWEATTKASSLGARDDSNREDVGGLRVGALLGIQNSSQGKDKP